MFRLTSNITVGNYRFLGVINLEISSSWDQFTDTCKITVPRKLEFQGQNIATGETPLIKRGDQVRIELGYDDENELAFTGYVYQINAKYPVTIDCQDEMFLLKTKPITQSFKDATLQSMLAMILPDVSFEALGVSLGRFRISNATPAKVLEELRKKYYIKSWFRDGVLYSGFAYVPKLQKRHKVKFEVHVIENNLTYFRSEDVDIELKMVAIDKNNNKVEYLTGVEGGERRTLYYYGLSLDDLKTLADEELQRLKYDGYKGSVKIFGQPFVRHGDIIDLSSEKYPERDGSYLIKSVNYTFGIDGFRQIITLDTKI